MTWALVLWVAIRTQEFQILATIIKFIPILMINLKPYRITIPHINYRTSWTCIRNSGLNHGPPQPMCMLPYVRWPEYKYILPVELVCKPPHPANISQYRFRWKVTVVYPELLSPLPHLVIPVAWNTKTKGF